MANQAIKDRIAAAKQRRQDAEDKRNNRGSGGNDLDSIYTRFERGTTTYARLLPGRVSTNEAGEKVTAPYHYSVSMHYLEYSNGAETMKAKVRCLADFGQHCPLCAAKSALWDAHNELRLERGKRSKFGNATGGLKVQERVYSNLLLRSTDDGDIVRVWSTSPTIFGKVDNQLISAFENDEIDIISPTEGHDLVIEVGVKSFQNRDGETKEVNDYAITMRNKQSKLAKSPDDIQAILDAQHDLTTLVRSMDYDKVQGHAEAYLNSLGIVLPGFGSEVDNSTQAEDPDVSEFERKRAEA